MKFLIAYSGTIMVLVIFLFKLKIEGNLTSSVLWILYALITVFFYKTILEYKNQKHKLHRSILVFIYIVIFVSVGNALLKVFWGKFLGIESSIYIESIKEMLLWLNLLLPILFSIKEKWISACISNLLLLAVFLIENHFIKTLNFEVPYMDIIMIVSYLTLFLAGNYVLRKAGIDLFGWIKKTSLSDMKLLKGLFPQYLKFLLLVVINVHIVMMFVGVTYNFKTLERLVVVSIMVLVIGFPVIMAVVIEGPKKIMDLSVIKIIGFLVVIMGNVFFLYLVIIKRSGDVNISIFDKEDMYLYLLLWAAFVVGLSMAVLLEHLGDGGFVWKVELLAKMIIIIMLLIVGNVYEDNLLIISLLVVSILLVIYLVKVALIFKNEYEKYYD